MPSGTPSFLPDESRTLLQVRALDTLLPDTLVQTAYPHFPPRGQLVSVEGIEGPGQERLGRDTLVVVVRWNGVDDACNTLPEIDSLPAGSRHLMRARLRPDSLWLEGRPTFDLRWGLLAHFPAPAPSSGTPTFADYRSMLGILPPKDAWEADCRPGVAAVEQWMEAHPGVRRHAPFDRVLGQLRECCLRSLREHADDLERGNHPVAVPDPVRQLAEAERCVDDSTTMMPLSDVLVEGHFVASDAPQWALICPRTSDWRLLVAVFESPPRIIELLRMEGHAWNWLVFAAPPEYFHWVCTRDVGSHRYQQPPPQRDVVLLWELEVEGARLAFYETPAGWVHARVEYCDAQTRGALDMRHSESSGDRDN